MTEPPENATARARFIPPSEAAWAVRTLARVATFMPKKPARMEKPAPSRKHSAVSHALSPMNRPISRNSAAMNTTRMRYSAFKKASAPSAMAAAISRMRSFPASALATKAALYAANSSAQTASTGVIYR